MRGPFLLLACAALAIAGAADAKSKRKAPPPPPRVWHYFNDAPSPFLQYSYLRIPDTRRTTLSCEDSGVIKIEQVLPSRPSGHELLVVDSSGQSDAADPKVAPDEWSQTGTSVSATFPIENPVIIAFAQSGDLRLAVGPRSFILPRAPLGDIRHFLTHCSP